MPHIEKKESGEDFLKSLGFPTITVHDTFTHFDFLSPGRRVLLIGPMGSGKTEFAARVWRDAAIAQKKSERVRAMTSTGMLDRRKVFYRNDNILPLWQIKYLKFESLYVYGFNNSAIGRYVLRCSGVIPSFFKPSIWALVP